MDFELDMETGIAAVFGVVGFIIALVVSSRVEVPGIYKLGGALLSAVACFFIAYFGLTK